MSKWRTPSFYGWLVLAAFIACFILTLLARIFLPDELTPGEEATVAGGLYFTSLLVGYLFANSRRAKLEQKQRGFTVILKSLEEFDNK